MKKPYLKSLGIRLIVCFILLCAALIIHSCKKDNNSTKQTALAPVISEAKAWYESTYPVAATSTLAATSRSKLTTRASNSTVNGIFDYSQHIKPNWLHAASYTRYNSGVVELPIDPSSPKIASDFKNLNTGQVLYKQQYSRSSFLLLNDGKSYQAYIMTIIADSAYINNDPSKLSLTTYRKRDPAFSGVVVYFTPTGKFISSYGYKNGTLIAPPPSSSSTIPLAKLRVRSINVVPEKAALAAVSYCIEYDLDTYYDGVLTTSVYLYTTCSGSESSGGGSGGGAGTSPAPTPCTPPASTPPPAEAARFNIDVAQPSPTPIGGDGDGGLPPPAPAPAPCPTTATVADTITDPCAQIAAVNAAAQNVGNTALDHQLFNDINTGHEYGDEENLTIWPPNGTYKNTAIATDLNDNYFTPTFTWDSTNGYTINISHDHPGGDAPSPADVFQLVINSYNKNLQAAGTAALNYYKQNATITTITTNGTYVVTIANYNALLSLYSQQSVASWNTEYETTANENLGSTEYALLTIFGSSINVYKSAPNVTTFSPLTLSSKGPVTTPCPN